MYPGRVAAGVGVVCHPHITFDLLLENKDMPASRWALSIWAAAMDAEKDREIIRLWNWLRALERQGQPTAAILKKIHLALAERERHAA